jgi:K+-sensing histidine kinase KdpD
LRDCLEGQALDGAPELLPDPDSVRELVHEIKTPLNAIIGFAEIIEGQYLGPADRPYRERAEEIVGQARLLLTAIDDLDFAAKVHSSLSTARPRTKLGELVEQTTPALRKLASERGVEIDGARSVRDTSAATESELAERLILRMCSAAIEKARAGERLRLTVEQAGDRLRVSITRPSGLPDLADGQQAGNEADLDRCFSLRLVRGLARIAGADLVTSSDAVSLLFPRS